MNGLRQEPRIGEGRMSQEPGEHYRGRLPPSPTGLLHLGHARTFWTAQRRAVARDGTLILRNDDLDRARCKPEFVAAMFEDLRWFGFEWQEGPDRGGPFAPYNQSERYDRHRAALKQLHDAGFIYPCTCSRKDIQQAATAPHAGDDEVMYPGTCRSKGAKGQVSGVRSESARETPDPSHLTPRTQISWRFRVPDGETIAFTDRNLGPQQFIAGKDFGDFVVWRSDDDLPAYQLASVADDAEMKITEVVRGADLLLSTARQLLLFRALNREPPEFYHCPLLCDDHGIRLAKRHDSLSLRILRAQGRRSEELRERWS